MISPPDYFHPIREKAVQRWNQLENDKELAGPWIQLFQQVQSPRHVVSELLQNADDVGATEAKIGIHDGVFVFEHNGEDFVEDQFLSLCRFGYSNKRLLHTIGFRGIGFKSTFSLGKTVALYTPTLAVAFHKSRFTQPEWIDPIPIDGNKTRVSVKIEDKPRESELRKNLREWFKNPYSLLFFRNIRRIVFEEKEIHWLETGIGPVKNSKWMKLAGRDRERYLHIKSDPLILPEEAQKEILEERTFSDETQIELPPCVIDIVVGTHGRLYVVLPTQVKTELSFAINAPFIQDPARLKIKDPETSPTNSWLLGQAGKLASEIMLEWLNNGNLTSSELAEAYDLLVDANNTEAEDTIEASCSHIVEESFRAVVEEHPFLLTDDDKVVPLSEAVSLPKSLYKIWDENQRGFLFEDSTQNVSSNHISDENLTKLHNWGIEEYNLEMFIEVLCNENVPRPAQWNQIIELWGHLKDELVGRFSTYSGYKEKVKIIPANGSNELHASENVVRLSKKALLESDEDLSFISNYLYSLDRYFVSYIDHFKPDDVEEPSKEYKTAEIILDELGLADTTPSNVIMDQVSGRFFHSDNVDFDECIRLTRIAAKLGYSVKDCFRFFDESKNLRGKDDRILANNPLSAQEDLRFFVPEEQNYVSFLHEAYQNSTIGCTEHEWNQWVTSGKSGLMTFIPILPEDEKFENLSHISEELRFRGIRNEPKPTLTYPDFTIDDKTFPRIFWKYWSEIEGERPEIWCEVMNSIINQGSAYWRPHIAVSVVEISRYNIPRNLTHETVPASWIMKFRDKKCLRDNNGELRKPTELLLRTQETEAYLNEKPFVDKNIDTEENAKLLRILGVQDTPPGPGFYVERLIPFRDVDDPPLYEIEKWYRRLDEITSDSSSSQMLELKTQFDQDRLFLTQDGEWVDSNRVFLEKNDSDVPGLSYIWEQVKSLKLWERLGVNKKPTEDLVIEWLANMPVGKLNESDLKRAEAIVKRFPVQVWEKCNSWINLLSEWTSIDELKYGLGQEATTPINKLDQRIRSITANFQMIPSELVRGYPFTQLDLLDNQIENKIESMLILRSEEKVWIRTLGDLLARAKFKNPEDTERVRKNALRLKETLWEEVETLEIVPYLSGTPIGQPRTEQLEWQEEYLYVLSGIKEGKLASLIPKVLNKVFDRTEIKDAIYYAIDRPESKIIDYMEQNFDLEDPEVIKVETNDPRPAEQEKETKYPCRQMHLSLNKSRLLA